MRKVLTVAALTAILGVAHAASAGAQIGGLPLPDVPDVAVGADPVCKTVFVPADVGANVGVKKKITLVGMVLLDQDVNTEVIRVVKTIAVQVCVKTEGDTVANVDIDAALDGAAPCPNGGYGAVINVDGVLNGGLTGGAVVGRVKIAVSDRDVILGEAVVDHEVVVDSEDVRVEVGPSEVDDVDFADVHACVGPVDVE